MSRLPEDARFATRAVHAGLEPDPSYRLGDPPDPPDLDLRAARARRVRRGLRLRALGQPDPHGARERAIGELEGGHGAAFASGMAATHALITAHCRAGDHVILPSDLYGGTYRLLDKVLARFGVAYDMVDQTDLDALERALRPDTTLVWVETPTNPLLNVVDIEAVVARSGRALVAVDNTFATPVIQRPLESGADAVVHSATKYLGGHSDVVGGLVVSRDGELHERVQFIQNAVGAVPGPFDCFLVHRGLRTLHLRVAAHGENGRAVSEFLRSAPGVRGRALARLRRHGLVPAPGGHPDRGRHPGLLAGGVAGRRGVADRGAPGHDPPVGGGLRRRRAGRPGAALMRGRGRGGPGGRPAPGDRGGPMNQRTPTGLL